MTATETIKTNINRHRTAISRPQLSTPFQSAARHGYLEGDYDVFDYGCGRGNDIAILEAAGIKVSGWDPHFKPNSDIHTADIVNLGFVLNVIENHQERIETLKTAFALANKLLIVSVLTIQSHDFPVGQPYQDGFLTERSTFQKYFDQTEIRNLIESTLGVEPLAVGRGLFFVFSDKLNEQLFLSNRSRRKHDISHLLALKPPAPGTTTWTDWIKFEEHQETLTELWEIILELGRIPATDELPPKLAVEIEQGFGSVRKSVQIAQVGFDPNDFYQSRTSRIEDLKVYFALNLFNQRKPYSKIPRTLQRDISVFFDSYKAAQESGKDLLFSVGDADLIRRDCYESAANGLGSLDGSHSLQIESSLAELLSPRLRTLIGCAEKLYGDSQSSNIIKIHMQSRKITFLEYEDFVVNPLPPLSNRVKVDLLNLQVDYFNYKTSSDPQILYLKSKFMHPTHPAFKKQQSFDNKLSKLNLFDFEGFGPSSFTFFETLKSSNLRVAGWQLKRIASKDI